MRLCLAKNGLVILEEEEAPSTTKLTRISSVELVATFSRRQITKSSSSLPAREHGIDPPNLYKLKQALKPPPNASPLPPPRNSLRRVKWVEGIGGICHSCRKPGHLLYDFPTKKRCPVCGEGIEKCMEVEKNTKNIGRMFFCCTEDYRHFKWKDEDERRDVEISVNISMRKGKGVTESNGHKKGTVP